MVTLSDYPQGLIDSGAVLERVKVEGHVTLYRIPAKQQIRFSDIVVEGQDTGAFELPEGLRPAVIHQTDLPIVSSGIKPGDHGNILATYVDPATQQETTQTILQNILVLALNKAETGSKPSMTVAAKPAEEELLIAADRVGALRVAKRPQ